MNFFEVIPLWIRLASTFVLGLVVGSFLNVCIFRLPWGRSIVRPGSHCPSCNKSIAWFDNIPVLSWLVLRGRCRHCSTTISFRYPGIELLTGALFALVYWIEVELSLQWVPGGPDPNATTVHWRYLYHLFLLCALIVATFIDFDYQVIPDSVTIPGMMIGLVLGCAIGQVHLIPAWIVPSALERLYIPPWFSAHPHVHGLIASAAGLVVGGGLVWLVRAVGYLVLRKEAMGFGDVTLMAMIGSFVGWQAAVLTFFFAPFFGVAVGMVQWLLHGESRFAYGPYLSLAALAVVLAWKPVWEWAAPIFGLLMLYPWLLPTLLVLGLGLLATMLVGGRVVRAAIGRITAVTAPDATEEAADPTADSPPAEPRPDSPLPEPDGPKDKDDDIASGENPLAGA